MKIFRKILPAFCILVFQIQVSAQTIMQGYDSESQAYLIVTATSYKNLETDIETDFTVAKGAIVRLRSSTGSVIEKQTEEFTIRNNEKAKFTADFKVDLDSSYTVEFTFDSKTYVIDDYCLKKTWKTHFLYHSTNGTKSAASVFRKFEVPEKGLLICLYGVFPYTNYKSLGGNQL